MPRKKPSTPAAPVASRSTYTVEVAELICAELSTGRSLRDVCGSPGMPSHKTVFRWLRTEPEFRAIYDAARQACCDVWASEILDIADEPPVIGKDGRADNAAETHRRTRIDSRKWLLAKIAPHRFSERIELTGAAGAPLAPVVPFTAIELSSMVAGMLRQTIDGGVLESEPADDDLIALALEAPSNGE
jgi:hypothetical protein